MFYKEFIKFKFVLKLKKVLNEKRKRTFYTIVLHLSNY